MAIGFRIDADVTRREMFTEKSAVDRLTTRTAGALAALEEV